MVKLWPPLPSEPYRLSINKRPCMSEPSTVGRLGRSEVGRAADPNMPEPLEIGFLSDPLRNVGPRFAQKLEVRVELMSHDSLVFAIVIADDIVPLGNGLQIYRPAVFKVEPHVQQQRGHVVFLTIDNQRLAAAKQASEAAFDQSPAPQLGHTSLTIPARPWRAAV